MHFGWPPAELGYGMVWSGYVMLYYLETFSSKPREIGENVPNFLLSTLMLKFQFCLLTPSPFLSALMSKMCVSLKTFDLDDHTLSSALPGVLLFYTRLISTHLLKLLNIPKSCNVTNKFNKPQTAEKIHKVLSFRFSVNVITGLYVRVQNFIQWIEDEIYEGN